PVFHPIALKVDHRGDNVNILVVALCVVRKVLATCHDGTRARDYVSNLVGEQRADHRTLVVVIHVKDGVVVVKYIGNIETSENAFTPGGKVWEQLTVNDEEIVPFSFSELQKPFDVGAYDLGDRSASAVELF